MPTIAITILITITTAATTSTVWGASFITFFQSSGGAKPATQQSWQSVYC